ncbi:replication initiation factor domain-containing protein [Listeria costaricensis]|uniref:replication initiation factor domain-containing protein n=1 Tax=Listeria costaricensis TaxID=2026604 RepID=UPI001F092D65|nr:replication initiation factor domain-containing protein [Listeria costaricensis]
MEAKIDYVRVSFKTHDVKMIMKEVLHLREEYFYEKQSGRYGYIGTWIMDFIQVYFSADHDDRGVLIEMSGQGCREFEAILECRKKTWIDFFQDCIAHKGNFTRIDLAIDDRMKNLNIRTLFNKMQKGECISKFRKFDFTGSADMVTGESLGTTIYFGSKKSAVYFCFYEKNFEQAQKLKVSVDEIGDWNRYELRLKDDRAAIAVQELLAHGDLMYIAKSIINHYIRFVNIKAGIVREKAKSNPKWLRFVDKVGKLRLAVEPKKEFYEKTEGWLEASCSPSMKMVYEMDKVMGTSHLSDMVLNASMSEKQEKMLEVKLAETADLIYW